MFSKFVECTHELIVNSKISRLGKSGKLNFFNEIMNKLSALMSSLVPNNGPDHKVKPSWSLKFVRNVFLPQQQTAKCRLCVCEEISAIDGQCFEIGG